MEQRRILVVDDDSDVLDATSALLEIEGYAVARARNGREALRSLAVEAADLILLDLMMPVMDGVDFCLALRSGEHGKTPVIVISADQTAPRKVREMDVQGFLGKPFDVDALLREIRRILPPPSPTVH